MRRLLCVILTLIAAAFAQAISTGARWVDSVGVVADNDPRWATFNDLILIGGYASPDALICRSYTTETAITTVWITNQWRQGVPVTMNLLSTNWGEIFVLTNYPFARKYRVGEGLNPHFAAMKMWDVEVRLLYASPIIDLSKLPPPPTNSAGLPVGYVSLVAPLFDCGVPIIVPKTNAPPRLDTGNGEYRLGMDYLNGVGHTKDPAVARDLFIKAAKKGQPEAMEQLRTNSLFGAMSPAETNKPPPKPTTEVSKPDEAKAALEKRLAEAEEELRKLRAAETPPTTNAVPAAIPVPKADEAATLAQLKEAHAALEKRLADSEEQLRKLRPPETQPKTSLLSGRWLWVVGILVVISALWLFNAFRERAE